MTVSPPARPFAPGRALPVSSVVPRAGVGRPLGPASNCAAMEAMLGHGHGGAGLKGALETCGAMECEEDVWRFDVPDEWGTRAGPVAQPSKALQYDAFGKQFHLSDALKCYDFITAPGPHSVAFCTACTGGAIVDCTAGVCSAGYRAFVNDGRTASCSRIAGPTTGQPDRPSSNNQLESLTVVRRSCASGAQDDRLSSDSMIWRYYLGIETDADVAFVSSHDRNFACAPGTVCRDVVCWTQDACTAAMDLRRGHSGVIRPLI